jgi:hypothetical protein
MTIMFAGGMTLAIPGMMPAVAADYSATDGYLSVSSTFLQGGAILEVVINDPSYSATDSDIGGGPEVTIDGTDYIATQAVDGKWYAYFADYSSSNDLDDTTDTGLDFGTDCAGLGTNGTAASTAGGVAYDIVASTVTVWAQAYKTSVTAASGEGSAGDCNNIDGAPSNHDVLAATTTSDATGRTLMSVLANTPAMSQWDTTTGLDGGQRLHILNDSSGIGSWPFIFADSELSSSNIVEYLPSGASIEVEFGNTDDETYITLANDSPSEFHEIHLAIGDPALNIDPTTPDIWMFNVISNTDVTAKWLNNGSNSWITDSELLANGCVDNCDLTTSDLDGDGTNDSDVLTGHRTINMTESGPNTGHFESWGTTGDSTIDVKEGAGGDNSIQFNYGGNSVMMIITYNDASMTLETESGGDWLPGEAATLTIVDPDLNKNPTEADELLVGDETAKVPTIKVGSPLTLTSGLTDGENLTDAATSADSNSNIVSEGVSIGNDGCGVCYAGHARDVYDQSERLRIAFDGQTEDLSDGTHDAGAYGTTTWINVTTGWTKTAISKLQGSTVLSYDISGATDLMSGVSAVSVYLTATGSNDTFTDTATSPGLLELVESGAASSGVANLCGASTVTPYVCSSDIHENPFSWLTQPDNNTAYATVHFKITHDASATDTTDGHGQLAKNADFAIAADLCNFDQNNGSDTHNCIYRIEAEETGENTGVFEGTVEYIQLNNSTNYDGNSNRGVAGGNDQNAHNLVVSSDADVTVVLMDGVDGTDSIRVSHNDTDALGAAEEVQKQLDAFTHTGTVDLDAGNYEGGDMSTITIVDPDLNMDSEDRETYTNSSGTFQITCTDGTDPEISSKCVTAAQVIIETGANTGVFVGTFTVPSELGEDMEITYYESADAAGESIEFYDIASISSNDGDVALSKSVYPLPFKQADIDEGDDTVDSVGHDGNVTATIIVTEPDTTTDTLTVTGGNIKVKLIHGITTTQLFKAGLSSGASSTVTDSVAVELGTLTETERGSMVYEVDMTISETMCGPGTTTAGGALNTLQCVALKSGDIIQVEYIDTTDGAGATSTFYDSSTFDLRGSSLSVDKDVYVIGSDMVVTLTEPDLNVDAASIETYALNLIEWDSDADGSELMNNGAATTGVDFTANPSKLQETGTDTGVFQSVITLPDGIYDGSGSTKVAIDFGEAVTLTYVDTGIAGEDDYGDDSADIEATFSISNFGALVELDKAVYNWTDTIYVTITAPDHNQNTASEETIGTSTLPIHVTTRSGKMCSGSTYKAVETDEDTGIFTSEVLLTGFDHTLSTMTDTYDAADTTCGSGDTDGKIQTGGQTDGVSVSYEYNDGSVVVASASIAWNIGETSWDSSSVSAGGSAVITVVDADENVDNSITDTFKVDVFSDSDSGGFKLVLNETDEDTGVFEGTVYFTSDLATSGTTLRVAEGDTVTAEYTDETLPEPYTTDDDLTIAATTTVGTAFPPLERAPAANARVVDAFGASVSSVSVDQQVQIAADVSNGQSGDQGFAYIVQVQDGDGVTVSLAWITGSLTAGQSMSPALSWTPSASGSYTATVFVWESVDNPTALSPTVSVDISVT